MTLLCAGARGQSPQYVTRWITFTNGWFMDGGTNNIKGGATNDYTTGGMAAEKLDVTAYGEWSLAVFFRLTGPGSSNVSFRIDNGVESNYWSAAQGFFVPANGTNQVGTNFNIYAGSVGWWRLGIGANTNTPDLTNLWAKWAPKPRRLN